MKIQVKNSQLNEDSINVLNQFIDMNINASAAFKLTRIIKEISSIVEDRVKMEKIILDRWVEKDENGVPVRPLDDDGNIIEGTVNITNMQSFSQEMTDLMETENTLQYDKIQFDSLGMSTARIKDIMKVDFLFQ